MSDASETPKGYFIDWDGKLRPIDQPGKGLRCEVDYKAKYVMVFNKYGGLDHEFDVVSERGGRRKGGDQGGPRGHRRADPDFVDRLIFAPRPEAARGGKIA